MTMQTGYESLTYLHIITLVTCHTSTSIKTLRLRPDMMTCKLDMTSSSPDV